MTMDFVAGGGEMAKLIRSKDWTKTPLGPVESWPQSLLTTVSLCLGSNFPINIIWGPEHTQIYNDGYRAVCGKAHPACLGMNYAVSWASAWPAIGEPFARALAGETSYLQNQRMFLHRNGYLEETFFTFSTSPIRDETGYVVGLFHPVTETTPSMLGERRTRAVRDLVSRLGEAETADQVLTFGADILASFVFDLPFVLFYHLEKHGGTETRYRLAAHTGLAAGTSLSPETLSPGSTSVWPVAELVCSHSPIRVDGCAALFGSGVPCGPYEEPPDVVFAMPISLPGSDLPLSIIIAGASPRLPINDAYRGFYDLVAAAVGAGLSNARALEEERKRVEALAAIDRAKTMFFANISHELRTPLTLMLGPLEDALAEDATLPPSQRERLELTYRNALRLLKLVNSLLDFSRIEAGRVEASFQPTNIADLTASLASNFRSACERAGLDFVVDCPPLDAPVYVDPDMWEKIVLNLLSNAFKFTLEGSITVALHEVGTAVELVVRDTGVGISAAQLPRVFERFHRIEGQRGRTHEGTGIGLALVEALVKLHGGIVGASSALDQGSEFRVTIPLGTAHVPPHRLRAMPTAGSTAIGANAFVEEALRWLPGQAGQRPAPSSGETEVADVKGRPRIIIADDNADMRAYVTKILTHGGYDVLAVEDGDAALKAARRCPLPDLILSDVMMPGLDGFALLRALRADPAMEGLLVILLSARAGEEARVEGLAAGADDYLTKPFSARELRARIDGAINLARQRRAAAARERDLLAEVASERGRAALRESEQRLHLALEAGRLGSWELDLLTDHLKVSDILRENFGLGASDPIATYAELLSRVHPDDLEMRRTMVSRAIETGCILDHEYRIVWPNGHVAWMQSRGRAFYGEDGTPLRMIGVSLDVTDRKQAEARQELLLAKMIEQRRDLERSNADLADFAYVASHDLKAPLRAISHLVQWISEDITATASSETHKNLKLLDGRVTRLQRLLDGLLAYSRAGRAESMVEEVELAQLVEEIVASLAPPPGFVIRCECEIPSVSVHRTSIRVVLENLIGNALKHHDRLVGRIIVAMRRADGVLEFRVSDDGPGIPERFHNRIFQIFETLERRDEIESSGIGLAIVKKKVSINGGQIWVESTPPTRGATFVFTWKEATT